MDQRFFRSKQFIIATAIALVIVGGAAAVYAVEGVGTTLFSNGCAAPRLSGTELVAPAGATLERDGRDRTVNYRVNASSYQGGTIDACTSVGEIIIEPIAGDTVEVSILIRGDTASAVERTLVDAAFRDVGGALAIAAWESQVGKSTSILGTDSADIIMIIRVPASGGYTIKAHTDVGDIRVTDLLITKIDARTDVGNIHVTDVDLEGDATLRTDIGNTLLAARSVQQGRLELYAAVGNAEALLPSRADVGYDVTGLTGVGSVEIRVGETEAYDSKGSVPGERETARTSGYASRPTQVVVIAEVDIGDVRVTTSTEDTNRG